MMGRDRQLTIAAVEAGPTLEEPELLSLPDDADGNQEFRDRSTGFPLNPEMVKEARTLEMQYMDGMRAWLEQVDRRSRLIGSSSTRAIHTANTSSSGSSSASSFFCSCVSSPSCLWHVSVQAQQCSR